MSATNAVVTYGDKLSDITAYRSLRVKENDARLSLELFDSLQG